MYLKDKRSLQSVECLWNKDEGFVHGRPCAQLFVVTEKSSSKSFDKSGFRWQGQGFKDEQEAEAWW